MQVLNKRKNAIILRSNTRDPRRNLPSHVVRKRGEANFLGAFQRWYSDEAPVNGVGAHHLAISGYGIADFVWLEDAMGAEQEGVMTKDDFRKELLNRSLTAFEMKLTDWKKAVQQAYRYSYFADTAIVVLPSERQTTVLPQIEFFRRMDVGLWFFDAKSRSIHKAFTPSRNSPRNLAAKQKAVDLFVGKLYLRFVNKCFDTAS